MRKLTGRHFLYFCSFSLISCVNLFQLNKKNYASMCLPVKVMLNKVVYLTRCKLATQLLSKSSKLECF